MNRADRLDELLSEYERRQQAGTPVTPEELCRTCPDLLPQMRWHVQAFGAFPNPPQNIFHDEQSGVSADRAATQSEYVGLRFHARGGLGEVSIARDPLFGRDVAIKRLQPTTGSDSVRSQRFFREAILTGRLEHPGIVPVYGVGADEHKQPCYAMRLIHGITLRDAIHAYHSDGGGNSVAFRDLLTRFVSVCQAVAYAHGRGVVHRDIKPGNVMVGQFGETILLDWGLAREQQSPDFDVRSEEPAPVREPAITQTDLSSAPIAPTEAGTVMGTPGYMAPEQAAGEPVGPAADVYSLGATLFTLLTDRTPTENSPPRPSSQPPLLAVARKAMARLPEERYPTALALADDVNHWLADEPVTACRESMFARCARWGRRNRALVRAAMAALFVCSIVLAVSTVLLKRAGDRERAAAASANRRKAEADESYRKARRAVDDLFVAVSDSRLKALPGSQPVRKELLRTALKYYQEFLTDHGDDTENRADIAATLTKVGLIVGEVESKDAAVGWHEKAVAAWRDVVAAELERSDYRRGLAGALDLYGFHLVHLGRLEDGLKAAEEAVAILEDLHRAEPTNWDHSDFLSRALVNLAHAQGKLGRSAEAVRTGQRGLVLDEEMIRQRPDDLLLRRRVPARWINLGLDLADLDRLDEAIPIMERACHLYGELCAELDAHPERDATPASAIDNPRAGQALAEFNLGFILMRDEQWEKARIHLLIAAARVTIVVKDNPTVRFYREIHLASTTYAALVGFELYVPHDLLLNESVAACEFGSKLMADDRSNPDYRPRLGLAHCVRGTALARLGQSLEASQAWTAADEFLPHEPGQSVVFQELFEASHLVKAQGYLTLRNPEAAAAAAQTVMDRMPNASPRLRIKAARVFARAGALSSGEDRSRYEQRAVQELKKAVSADYRKADRLGSDPAFALLRGRSDYRSLEETIRHKK